MGYQPLAKPDFSLLEGACVYAPVDSVRLCDSEQVNAWNEALLKCAVRDANLVSKTINREILLRKLDEETHDEQRDTLYPFYAPVGEWTMQEAADALIQVFGGKRESKYIDDWHTLDLSLLADRVVYLNRRGATSTDNAKSILDNSLYLDILTEDEKQETILAWAMGGPRTAQYEDAAVEYEEC